MLHYKTYTNSQFDKWVVMVHGAGGSIEVWFRQVADYARHFNLLLVDLAGHGGSASESFGKGFNFSRAAEQVMEVVNHLKIEKGQVSTLLTLATTFKRLIPYSLIKKVIAKCIIPQEKYEKSKRLFLNNAKKVSFDSFLNWLKLGDGVGRYIKELFDEYISIPTLYLMGEDDKLFLPQVQQTVRNSREMSVSSTCSLRKALSRCICQAE